MVDINLNFLLNATTAFLLPVVGWGSEIVDSAAVASWIPISIDRKRIVLKASYIIVNSIYKNIQQKATPS